MFIDDVTGFIDDVTGFIDDVIGFQVDDLRPFEAADCRRRIPPDWQRKHQSAIAGRRPRFRLVHFELKIGLLL
jgi:hypothetical protein